MKSGVIGVGGLIASIGLGELNHVVGILCGAVALASAIPGAIQRWRKFFREKK